MLKTTLVIMAAGFGTRFGGGIKQLQAIGPNGELLMDYSIHDAIRAGFNKIVFILRRDIIDLFHETIGARVEAVCRRAGVEIAYAFQEVGDIPFALPEGRTKPWGTGHAVLCARELLREPFAVINADDYYGKAAYADLHAFLTTSTEPTAFAMAGFILKNTLSETGGVTRGLCSLDEGGFLTDVKETHNIVKTPSGAAADGAAIDIETPVSMNMWALTPAFLPMLESGFIEFSKAMADPLKDEFLLPVFINRLLHADLVTVRCLPTQDRWLGMTYREDRDCVADAIARFIREGIYKEDLYGDI